MLFGRNCQRYIINVTTKKIHWGLEREIIDFEDSLPKTRWGVKKYESCKRLSVRELRGKIDISFRYYLEEIVRGILLT